MMGSDHRTRIWERLFTSAMAILDSAIKAGMPAEEWSFGGGTMLMLRYRHRFSKDIDIFVTDPQYLGFLTPRLNDVAEVGMADYLEQSGSIKIYYQEGEIDFVAAGPLTDDPFEYAELLGRRIKTERPAEIVGKKIQYRAEDFKARDIFDLALVLDREPEARPVLKKFLEVKREVLKRRFFQRDAELREDFALIDVVDYNPAYDDCVARIRACMDES